MNGDCSSDTASATPSAPSKTGSPVVFSKSDRTTTSRSVSVLAPEVTKNEASAARMATTTAVATPASHQFCDRLPRARTMAGAAEGRRTAILGSPAATASALAGRSSGAGASDCMMTRSSCGLTFVTIEDGSGGALADRGRHG